MFNRKLAALLVAVLLAGLAKAHATDVGPLLASWLASQTNIQSWSADFTQTRTLKSLAQPLTATGHVWFAFPNRFRWELGNPAQTIAVREPQELLIVYPRLKRAEHFPLSGGQTGAWGDALELLQAGFPRSQAELEAQYTILSQTVSGQDCTVVLKPKSAAARRLIPQIRIDFDKTEFSLRGTELQFADGSSLRNDFRNPQVNPKLELNLFTPAIPSDYRNIEPLKNAR